MTGTINHRSFQHVVALFPPSTTPYAHTRFYPSAMPMLQQIEQQIPLSIAVVIPQREILAAR